jgi:hypothetical protein
MIEYEKRWSVKGMTQMERKLFYCWKGIKNRCYAPGATMYRHYGGRGISMSPLWRNDFLRFVQDVGFPERLDDELDRTNNEGNYELGNVRWVTRQKNLTNTRSNQWVEIDGVKKLASQWADEHGISRPTFCVRMKLGWPGRDLLAKPWTGARSTKITIDGVTKPLTEWAKVAGINHVSLRMRVKQGIVGRDLIAPPSRNSTGCAGRELPPPKSP